MSVLIARDHVAGEKVAGQEACVPLTSLLRQIPREPRRPPGTVRRIEAEVARKWPELRMKGGPISPEIGLGTAAH
jgi:hypothetical protein